MVVGFVILAWNFFGRRGGRSGKSRDVRQVPFEPPYSGISLSRLTQLDLGSAIGIERMRALRHSFY